MTNLNATLYIKDFANISLQIKEQGLSSLPDFVLLAWMEDRLQVKEDIKNHPSVSQKWFDNMNQDLIEIDAEFESRRPIGEFRTLNSNHIIIDKFMDMPAYYMPIGFEYLGPTCSCGRVQKDCTFPYYEAKND